MKEEEWSGERKSAETLLPFHFMHTYATVLLCVRTQLSLISGKQKVQSRPECFALMSGVIKELTAFLCTNEALHCAPP